MAIKKPCAGLCNHGYCSSASCRVSDGFYAKRSGIGLFDGRSVEVVLAVVMTKRPLEKLVLPSKSAITCETSVFRSAATSPLILASGPTVQTDSLVVVRECLQMRSCQVPIGCPLLGTRGLLFGFGVWFFVCFVWW